MNASAAARTGLALLMALLAAGPPAAGGARASAVAAWPASPHAPCAPQTNIFVDSGQALGSDTSLGVALGDMNGDDTPDALIANAAGPNEQVWLNLGGVYSFTQTLGDFLDTPAAALADFDNDSDLDAVTIGFPALIYRNNGQAQFSQVQFLTASNNNAGAVGQLDGALGPDLVLAGNGSSIPAQVFWNTGVSNAPFSAGPTLGMSKTVSVLIGNLDAGGAPDILLINTDGQPSRVWLNNANGTFSAGPSLTFPNANSAALGDLDGDSDLDVWLVAAAGGSRVWLNNGAAGFSAGAVALGTAIGVKAALADLDGDDDLDAVVAGSADEVWLNDGAGQFCLAQTLPGSTSLAVALADVDGDDDLDAFMAGVGPNRVWLNQGGAVGESDLSLTIVGRLWTTSRLESYSLIIHNSQAAPAQAVRLVITPDAGATVDSWHSPADNLCTVSPAECSLGTLPAGSSMTVTVNIAFVIPEYSFATIRRIRVHISSNPPDAVPGNNWLEEFVKVYDCTGVGACATDWLTCGYLIRSQAPQSAAWGGQEAQPAWPGLAGGEFPLDTLIDWFLISAIRDNLLGQTAAGQHYIDLYYTHDPEILSLLMADDELRDEAGQTLLMWQPNLAALLAGLGGSVTITAEQVQAIENFLQSLTDAGSPALQQAIAGELSRHPLGPMAGKTMSEARSILVGYGLFLPLVQR